MNRYRFNEMSRGRNWTPNPSIIDYGHRPVTYPQSDPFDSWDPDTSGEEPLVFKQPLYNPFEEDKAYNLLVEDKVKVKGDISDVGKQTQITKKSPVLAQGKNYPDRPTRQTNVTQSFKQPLNVVSRPNTQPNQPPKPIISTWQTNVTQSFTQPINVMSRPNTQPNQPTFPISSTWQTNVTQSFTQPINVMSRPNTQPNQPTKPITSTWQTSVPQSFPQPMNAVSHPNTQTNQPTKPMTSTGQTNNTYQRLNQQKNEVSYPVSLSKPAVSYLQTNKINQSLTQSKNVSSFVSQPSLTPNKDTLVFKQQLYNPLSEDKVEADMDISDDEKQPQNTTKSRESTELVKYPDRSTFKEMKEFSRTLEIKSGAAFYQGLILYIPCFDQISNSYKGSPAMKMLFASFEFSFKIPVKIDIKQRENDKKRSDVSVCFRDHTLVKASSWTQAAHNDICVKALELLSETCYTIQAKEAYLPRCKLIDASELKTLNLKKWEFVRKKYPELDNLTNDSHLQKTFCVFLASHTITGIFEDIVCYNLTRTDLVNIKRVVDFFHLTMLPCCVAKNLSKKDSPCVISIHKYTSAKKLLDILIECGGENDKFRVYPPDTFKDFYKLHQNYWDPALQSSDQNKVLQLKTTLEDKEMQAEVLNQYENIVSALFEKVSPKAKKQTEDSKTRQTGDNFMKETLQIDMEHSKKIAPLERMQLLLKYMEQLQEYGNRVLSSGHPEMIKIYHNAIENVRKDLDSCGKDIEKEQKDKEKEQKDKTLSQRKSPSRQTRNDSRKRSVSPRKRTRSRSPRKYDRRRSVSPRKRLRSISPRRRSRSRSRSPRSRRKRSRSPRSRSPRSRSPKSRSKRTRSRSRRRSPRRSDRSPTYEENTIVESIFKHKLKKFIEMLRRNHIEIENTPVQMRISWKETLLKYKEQLDKFHKEVLLNRRELGSYFDEIAICEEELQEQAELIAGKLGPHDVANMSANSHNIMTGHPTWNNSVPSFQGITQQHIPQHFPGQPPPPGLNSPLSFMAEPPVYRPPF